MWRAGAQKRNISEKRTYTCRGKVTMDGPIGNHQRSFERYHPDPLRPPLPHDWGFAIPPQKKLQLLLYEERVKLRTSNLAGTFRGSIRTKAH